MGKEVLFYREILSHNVWHKQSHYVAEAHVAQAESLCGRRVVIVEIGDISVGEVLKGEYLNGIWGL